MTRARPSSTIKAFVCLWLLISCLAIFVTAADATQVPAVMAPSCSQVLANFQGAIAVPGLKPFSDGEMRIALGRIENDPSLRDFTAAMNSTLAGDSALAAAVNSKDSLETQVFLGYLRWVAYRSEKAKIASKEENEKLAKVDPAFRKTNVMEVFDLLMTRLIRQGERIPGPIVTLVFELMQSGVERIQSALDSRTSNGNLSDVIESMEFLKSGQSINIADIHRAVMKLALLDGGAPFAIQRPQRPFTDEEKNFFAKLDPNSPLTLPSRTYSEKMVEGIRFKYPGTPLSQITTAQADAAIAESNRWLISSKICEQISNKYGKPYAKLSVAEIDRALEELGEITLMKLAQYSREGVSRRTSEGRVRSLSGPTSTALVPTQNSHPLALALSSATELANYKNTASQMPDFKHGAEKIERALEKVDRHSPKFADGMEVYRTYLNLGMYAPHTIASALGLFESLAAATVEFGTEKEKADFQELVEWKFNKIRSVMFNRPFRRDKTGYFEVAHALINFVSFREHWDLTALRFVFNRIEWLSKFENYADMDHFTAAEQYRAIMNLRRAEKLNESSLDAFLESPRPDSPVHFGVLSFKASLVNSSVTKESGRILSIQDVRETQSESGDMHETILRLEDSLRGRGFDGIQFIRPVRYTAGFLKNRADYTEGESPPDPQGFNDPSFYKSFNDGSDGFDPAQLLAFLHGTAHSRWIDFNVFTMNLRRVDFNLASDKQGKSLTIVNLDSKQLGSGKYLTALRLIEKMARKAGFVSLMVEGVDNPRQWTFYEQRAGYKRRADSHDKWRIYFIEL